MIFALIWIKKVTENLTSLSLLSARFAEKPLFLYGYNYGLFVA